MIHCKASQNLFLVLTALLAVAGCRSQKGANFSSCGPEGCYDHVAADIEYPATSDCTDCTSNTAFAGVKPWTISTVGEPEYWDLSLQEAIQLAMSNSEVLTELGGAVVQSPGAVRTQYDAAITETDPRQGVESALSVFDAEFASNVFFDKNDRQINNIFLGQGIRQFNQDLMNWNTEIRKRSVTGSEFSIRHHVDYDANNAPANAFPSAFNAWIEGEIRQPLLQGGGAMFNRIAGPTRTPGVYNGVLIARLNTDVQLTEFEISVRDFVSNLENAYWDLYFAYRDLDAKIAARDDGLETWRKVHALFESGSTGGEAYKEAQAREQFHRFQEEVQNALSGSLLDGTRTSNGSPGGTFRAAGGVHVAERRLRLLMGLPPSDGRLLRPMEEPVVCRIEFDWDQVSHESTSRRAELRRQRWQIRRRELELIASKNHLLPRLDAVGRYRWRGFGDNLFGASNATGGLPAPITGASAYDQLTSGNYQEWQLGVELSMPIGFRRAHTGVRNAELLLARERALLEDQQLEIVHQSAGAIAEVDRAFTVSQTAYRRLMAAQAQLKAMEALDEEGEEIPLVLLLDAQKRRAEAQSHYYHTLTAYAVAIKNVHYTKGTLLEFCGIYLAEGSWPSKAHCDAANLERRRGRPRPLNYASSRAPIVSRGSYVQHQNASTGPAFLGEPVFLGEEEGGQQMGPEQIVPTEAPDPLVPEPLPLANPPFAMVFPATEGTGPQLQSDTQIGDAYFNDQSANLLPVSGNAESIAMQMAAARRQATVQARGQARGQPSDQLAPASFAAPVAPRGPIVFASDEATASE